MKDKFEVVDRNNKHRVTGFDGFSISVDNRMDAVKLCEYLNGMERLLDEHRGKRVEYYTALTKIKMIVEQIHSGSGELHIIELAIKIKALLKEVL